MPRNRVIALVVIGFIAVVGGILLLVGLLLGDDTDLEEQPDAGVQSSAVPDPGAADPPEQALAPYYSQDVAWEACEDSSDDDQQCATMTVPLDYDDPDGETIDLALLRTRAAGDGERLGSMVVNPGGPGAPGTEYAAVSTLVFRPAITEAYDVVGFDPRGTGRSAPVDCLTDAEVDDFFAADPSPDGASEREAADQLVTDLAEGCAERSGGVQEHVSTLETARDMDVLRAALGDAELTYFGASYGTSLGATYAQEFPDRVGRFVLDGGLDPGLTSREVTLGQAGGFQTALEAFVGSCVDDGDCALGDSLDAGLDRISQLLDDIDADPLPTGGERELTPGLAFYGMVQPLYAEQLWPMLEGALTQAIEEGDGTTLLGFADTYASRQADGSYANNSAEAIYAINCLDDPYALTAEEAEADLGDFEAASPTFGDVFAYSQTACLGFPGATSDEQSDVPEVLAEGAAPMVVVGTTRDPATPYEWSVSLAERLDSGVLVSRDGDGHTGYNQGNACVDEAVETYLVTGEAPDDGLEC